MKNMLFGIETEYALAGPGRNRSALATELVNIVARDTVSLPGMNETDRYLVNGSRLYIDSGAHPELSTPECSNPTEVLRYIRAGEEILTRALGQMASALGSDARSDDECVELFRGNVDYSGAKTTWGSHESYLYRSNPNVFPDQLIPHLVSRVIYTGAGGFNPFSGGIQFTLSPRAWHLQNVTSRSSTEGRGIFHLKNEPLTKKGLHRLHLLCGETLCSDVATWLRIGITAVVVAMIDGGVRPGTAVSLASPIHALRAFIADPNCRAIAETNDGRQMSALQIQRHYLEAAEASVGKPWMPDWAAEVCMVWRAMLDHLEEGPDAVCTRLDWAIKLPIYRDHIQRRGFRWDDLPAWNHVNDAIRSALGESSYEGRATVELVLGQEKEPSPIPETIARLTPFMTEHSLSWDLLRPFVDLRKEVFELDFRFGQLGARGFFGQLDRDGVLDHRIGDIGPIDEAMHSPPPCGRARVRGRRIKMYAEREGYRCFWNTIYDLRGRRRLNMSDPFACRAQWRKLAPQEIERLDDGEIAFRASSGMELLEWIRRYRR